MVTEPTEPPEPRGEGEGREKAPDARAVVAMCLPCGRMSILGLGFLVWYLGFLVSVMCSPNRSYVQIGVMSKSVTRQLTNLDISRFQTPHQSPEQRIRVVR